MPANTNRRWVLAARPEGYPKPSDFRLEEREIPVPRHGEVQVETLWLSLDPYMRGRMSAARSYARPVDVGGVIQGEVVGRVVKSASDALDTGDIVTAQIGWQTHGIVPGHVARKVDPSLAPISTALGVLGMPGVTAYFGLLEVGQPRAGDTVVVSAASGAVGAVVGQIAKIAGCRVVGIAGSDEKIAYVTKELGFDGGINYKTEDVADRLGALCPNGVDVYFDNVGGAVTDAVLANLADYSRVAICGQISQYNLAKPEMGPRNLRLFLTHRARLQGFLVWQFQARFDEARERLAAWIREGRLKYRQDVVDGFENAPQAFIGMMQGKNFGKLLVKVVDE